MDQLNDMAERKDRFTLIDEELGENSLDQLVDTLLLTVLDITSRKGKISKTFINAELLEFYLYGPNSNANIIIQYDLKPVNESVPFVITSDRVFAYEYNKEFFNEKRIYLEKELELQFPLSENHRDVSKGNSLREKAFIFNDDINNYKRAENYSSPNLQNNRPIVHMLPLLSENTTYSCVEKVTPHKTAIDMCLPVEENKLKKKQFSDLSHSYSVCGKPVSSPSDKRRHENTHTVEKPYSFTVCGKSFASPSKKSNHEKSHTREKPYSCSVCGRCFSRTDIKMVHERTHTGEKPYSCSVCGKSFACPSNKSKHEKLHTREKPYSCSVCGRCFSRMDGKMRHERSHTGEKPYSCSVCGKSFSCPSNKYKHEKIHTEKKSYSCSVCGRCFSRTDIKMIHERTHTGEKPYSCSVCGKPFACPSNKSKHEKIHTRESLKKVLDKDRS